MNTQPEIGSRRVSLFRNGRNQAMRIPREMELAAKEALVFKEGNRLIIEPIQEQPSLLEQLARMEPLTESFPDVDASLGELDHVDL